MHYAGKTVLFLFVLSVLSLSPLVAQDIDISDIAPRDLDPSMLDITDASFYFQGPLELYVDGLQYGDRMYAALLKFDGERTIEVFAPDRYGAGMRPQAIDLSRVSLTPHSDGTITIAGAALDGHLYSATVSYVNGRTLEASADFSRIGEVPRVPPDVAARIQRLQDNLSSAESTVETQRQQIQELRRGDEAIGDLQDRIASLRSDVSQRDDRITSLRETVNTLETRIRNLENPRVPRLPRVLRSGFDGQSLSFGDWARPGDTLRQTDPTARFAKVVFPVRQAGREFTFSVEATVPDAGWVGYGLHFLADRSETVQGYGYGDSYLVWLTRDPLNQSDRGFIQLYRSFNDIHMVQVASAILPISNFNRVRTTVYVNADNNEAQVFVEGRYAFSFPAENLKTRGSSVAVRALGPVTFTDLKVRGR